MTKLTDGIRTVGITMNEWTGRNYTIDWSADFFNVGSLTRNDEDDTYKVDDVLYCIGQALDWANGTGDYYDCDVDEEEISRRNVDLEEFPCDGGNYEATQMQKMWAAL